MSSLVRRQKNSSFGFSGLAFVRAKTKCAYLRIGLFSMFSTVSRCKVGVCGLQTYHTDTNFKWDTTVEFTTITPILYIHFYQLAFVLLKFKYLSSNSLIQFSVDFSFKSPTIFSIVNGLK